MINITKEIEEMIKEGEGKYKNLLIFKRIIDGKLYPKYVKYDENTEEIIKNFTSDIHYMGTNLGVLLEFVYNHAYISVEKIPFDRFYDIEKGMNGYIDPEGNFYSLGKINEHREGVPNENAAGKVASDIVLLLNISEEEKEKFKMKKDASMEKNYLTYKWPANEILKREGFCLFFRGVNAEGTYKGQSYYYSNATEKQLLVISYLYTLNYCNDENIEYQRKKLIRRWMDEK